MKEPSERAQACLLLAAAAYAFTDPEALMKALRIAYDVGFSEGRLAGGIEMREVISEQMHAVTA